MNRTLCAAALAALSLTVAEPLSAQQQIEWKQTLNTPKGLNMPSGVKGDILGIELGDTYAEAKVKLERFLAEAGPAAPAASPCPPRHPRMPPSTCELEQQSAAKMMGSAQRPQLQQTERRFQVPVADSAQVIVGSYVAEIMVQRQMRGASGRPIDESLQVFLTAPSSGHQVVGVRRFISYHDQADQPRIGPLITALKDKFKTDLRFHDGGSGARYQVMFDNGKAVVPDGYASSICGGGPDADERDVPNINPKGICDVEVDVSVTYGISKDHAKSAIFSLNDSERTKLNLTADYAFIRSYVKALQDRTKGPQPKL